MRDIIDGDGLAAATPHDAAGAPAGFSRRDFVRLLTAGGLSLAVPPSAAAARPQAEALHQELARIAGLVESARDADPNLPGFRNLDGWAAKTFPKDLGPREAEILQGALYMKALKLLDENRRRNVPAPTLNTVREVFANPEPGNCLTPASLGSLLKATQDKMSRLPDFRDEVRRASERVAMRRIRCVGGGGGEIPGWLCGCILIGIVILIVVIVAL